MDFKDQIRMLGERVSRLKELVSAHESAKNTMIIPFIKELGYDVYNPFEVTPELLAEGTKKGDKIDFAIMHAGMPIILIQCKDHTTPLNAESAVKLGHYFKATTAKFSILTNGVEYHFFTDLAQPSKMDDTPFFSFDITTITDHQIDVLAKFHKSYYNFDAISDTARELKFTYELKKLFHVEFTAPGADFVRHFTKQVYPEMITEQVLQQFTDLTRKSMQQYVGDLVSDRLKAIVAEKEAACKIVNPSTSGNTRAPIITTAEELEAFLIVKTILRQKINPERIAHRDSQSYFAILLDDNNRKTICRLYLGKRKFIAFNDQKVEVRHEMEAIDDIFKYAGALLRRVEDYDKKK